jgi:hypothetical protein
MVADAGGDLCWVGRLVHWVVVVAMGRGRGPTTPTSTGEYGTEATCSGFTCTRHLHADVVEYT